MHARSIQDAAFSEFRRQLTYKANWYGRTVMACDRWYASSKTCSHCDHKLDELRSMSASGRARSAAHATSAMSTPLRTC